MLVKKKKSVSSKNQTIQDVPPGKYMCAAQLAFFRARLENEKRALLENAQKTLDYMQAVGSAPDPNDRASTEEKYLLELRIRDRERKLLKKIDEALLRINHGTYGWCEETGEPIGIPRLLARPTASLCLEAQKRHEMIDQLYNIPPIN
jgi:DnaK suppressor protein